MLDDYILTFINSLTKGEIELYNEAGLQYELGCFLRSNNINTKFEYSTDRIFAQEQEFLKKEMDLYVKGDDGKYCIELKFPRKGAYPRRMTQSLIDIFFLQQLVNNGFKKGYFLFVTDLPLFKRGKASDGIYSYFRTAKLLNTFCSQDVPKFMKEGEARNFYHLLYAEQIELGSDYKIEFREFASYYYFLLVIEN